MLEPGTILTRLLAISGETGNEQAILDAAVAVCRDLGLDCQRSDFGVWATVQGKTPGPRLLFNSHLDTVPAGEGWTYPSQKGVIENGWIIGRGAVDARGSCAAMLAAAARVQRAGLKTGDLIVALSIGEEGDNPSLPRLLPLLGPIDAALVGEPTGLDIATSQRGLLMLELSSHGKQAHAARGKKPGAIDTLVDDLLALRSVPFPDLHPALGAIRITPTRLNAGVADNVMPGTASAVLDIRTTPAYTNAAIVESLQRAINGTLRIQSDHWIPCEIPDTHPLVNAARQARAHSRCFASDAASDWAFLQRANIAAIKTGPGNPSFSHQADERISIDELADGVQTYERIATHFLAETTDREDPHV